MCNTQQQHKTSKNVHKALPLNNTPMHASDVNQAIACSA